MLLYKSLHYSNTFVGILGFLYLPYATVTLWAPVLDGRFRKRRIISYFGFGIAILFGLLTFSVSRWSRDLEITFPIIILVAFGGASFQSVGIRGFLLHALSKAQLPMLSAIAVASNRLGIVVGSSILITGAAILAEHLNIAQDAWVLVFGAITVIMLVGTAAHSVFLPKPPTDVAEHRRPLKEIYGEVVCAVREIPRLGAIVLFLLIYRFGEGLLVRMIIPFFMDNAKSGGLGFSVGATAFMTGSAGFVCTIIGGLLGGWIIKRYTLQRVMLPFSLCMLVPHFAYIYLESVHPTSVVLVHIGKVAFPVNFTVQLCICLESFGYGIGYSGSTYLQFLVCRGRYRASLYAFTNALVSVGWLLPLTLSGWLQSHLGYRGLFILSIVTALPGIACIYWLPLKILEKPVIEPSGAPAHAA